MSETQPERRQPWIVAVDGGGSKIAVAGHPLVKAEETDLHARVLENLSQVDVRLWHFEGTGSAHPSTWPKAADNLALAIDEVAARLNESRAEIGLLKLALAGAGRTDDQARVIETLRTRCQSLKGVQIVCMGDIEPLVDYSTQEQRCIAVILGTGSVVAARNQLGELIRAGGWGPLLGDACSGGAIGLSALRFISQLLDEGQPSEQFNELARAIVAETRSIHAGNLASLNSLLIQTASDRAQTARLAGVVLQRAYEASDRSALELLEPHLADIVWQIRQVARRAELNELPLRLNFTGGIAEHHQPLRAAIKQACISAGLNVVGEELVDPLAAVMFQPSRKPSSS